MMIGVDFHSHRSLRHISIPFIFGSSISSMITSYDHCIASVYHSIPSVLSVHMISSCVRYRTTVCASAMLSSIRSICIL